jgi:transposase
MNQMRGFPLERGITMRKGPSHLAAQLKIVFGEVNCSFSGRTRGLLLELKHEWDELERRIEEASAELQRIAKQDDACSRLMEIPGTGPLVSTALVASVGNASPFEKEGIWLHGWASFHANTLPVAGRSY